MGWFGGSSNNDKTPKSDDPLRDLNPDLREFLKKESPIKYDTSNPPSAPTPRTEPKAASAPTSSPVEPETNDEGKPPPQSLFQDGRYAHLWKTYQPQADIEAASKSDQEKIDDIVQGYKQRKGQIGRAALENCALEQWEVNNCFRNGNFKDTITMCKRQNRDLSQCYNMQSKFLRALGYLSNFDNPEQDEKIQMHADTLYHRMLDQEKAIEAAKAEGRPPPKFPPLLSQPIPSTPNSTSNSDSNPTSVSNTPPPTKVQPSDLPPEAQEQIKDRLKGLDDTTREIEERAILEEIRAGEKAAGKLGAIYQREQEERRKRREEGKETAYDKLAGFFTGRKD